MNIVLLMSAAAIAVLVVLGYLLYCGYCRNRYPKGEGKVIECLYERKDILANADARKETLSQHNIDLKIVAHSRLISQKVSPDFGPGHWECKIEYYLKK